MNIKDKILFLRSNGLTQVEIHLRTGIAQSSVSKIENNDQSSVSYSKGVALDGLIDEVRSKIERKTLST